MKGGRIKMEKVSIIIPFYNCSYIQFALESALHQTYPHIEVIVVNDGSTQHTEKIEPYLPYIQYIEKQNGGTASALNEGIAQSKGEYVCWLSSDDVLDHKKVEIQLTYMKQRGARFSYTNYYTIDSSGSIISEPLGIFIEERIQFIRRLSKGNIVNGCSVMIHKEVFQQVGLFDELLPYTHDYDLWLRIVQYYDVHYISDSLLFYRVHKEMGTKKHQANIRRELKSLLNKHRIPMKQLLQREQQNKHNRG